jgi:hypothetical protein
MPNLYNSFCYQTLTDAVNSDLASPIQSAYNGLVSPLSITPLTDTTVTMTYQYKDLSTSDLSSFTLVRSYPACTSLGQINNNSGITVADAVAVSFAVVLVWLTAFYFKMLRTGVRGY